MASPYTFRKTSARGYAVTVKDTGADVGIVVRTTPDHATFTARWNATTPAGDYLGAGYPSRDAAARALADRAAEQAAAEAPADAPLSDELVAELTDDALAAHARGMAAAPALSAVVMREAEGQPVGSPHFTKVATTWANAYQAERDKAAAAVLAEPDPEYAHRGDDALRVMGARGDDAALVELDRRRAAERAAWNAQYARGNKPTETPAVELPGRKVYGEVTVRPSVVPDALVVHDPSGAFARMAAAAETPAARLEYLRGELRAERISYGELAELQGLAEHIDPGDVELLEAAGVPELPEDEEDEEGAPDVFQDPETGTYWRTDGKPGHACPDCGNGYATADIAGPDGHDCAAHIVWGEPRTVAAAELARLRSVADRARQTGAVRPADGRNWLRDVARGVMGEAWTPTRPPVE